MRLLQAQHVGGDFYKNFPDLNRTEDDAAGLAIDRAIASAVALIPASTFPDNLRVPATARGRDLPPADPVDG